MSGAVLTALLAVELYFLLHDVPVFGPPGPPGASRSPGSAAPIAELISRRNSVRSQAAGELVWEDTRDGQTLYRKQTLLTLAQARAEVAFLDGTGLVLDENSMIQLEKNPSDDSAGYQRIVVTLMRGTLHKREPRRQPELLRKLGAGGVTPEFEIHVGNSTALLNPNSELTVTAAPENLGGNRIVVQSGDLKLQTPEGQLTLKQGEEATVAAPDSQQPPVSRKAPFSLLGPAGGDMVTARGETAADVSVRFRWNVDPAQTGGSPLELEASRTPDFSAGVRKILIAATHPPLEKVQATLDLPAAPGPAAAWFWRVRAVARNDVRSAVGGFFVQREPHPEPRYPLPGALFRAGTPVDLSWESTEDGALGYEIEVRNSATATVTATLHSSENRARIDRLEPGQFEWRVRAGRRNGAFSPWSDYRKLVSFPADAPAPAAVAAPPPPVELMDPEIEPAPVAPADSAPPAAAPQSWLERLLPSANAGEAGTYLVKLKWRAVSGVKKYRIQIGRQSSFQNILAEAETTEAQWTWSYRPGMENSKGRVFYRVASVSESGRTGQYSAAKPVAIPQRILDLALGKGAAPAGHPRSETYSAVDPSEGAAPAAGPGGGDAAGAADANILGRDAQGVSAAPAPAPSPGPPAKAAAPATAAPRISEAAVDERLALRPPAPHATPPPPAPDSGVPPLAPEPEAPASAKTAAAPAAANAVQTAADPIPEETPYRDRLTISVGVFSGFGSLSQRSGDDALRLVSLERPYLKQKLGLAGEFFAFRKPTGELIRHWTMTAELAGSAFTKASGTRTAVQPDVKAIELRARFLNQRSAGGSWQLSWGGTLDRDFRWVKTGPQTVDAQAAFSAGPAAQAVKFTPDVPAFAPCELGATLALPLSGILTSGPWGAEALLWGEWRLTHPAPVWLGLRLEGESGYVHWPVPAGTSLVSWVLSAAPVFHLGSRP